MRFFFFSFLFFVCVSWSWIVFYDMCVGRNEKKKKLQKYFVHKEPTFGQIHISSKFKVSRALTLTFSEIHLLFSVMCVACHIFSDFLFLFHSMNNLLFFFVCVNFFIFILASAQNINLPQSLQWKVLTIEINFFFLTSFLVA